MRDPKRTGQLVDVYRLREERAEAAVSTASSRVQQERQRHQALEQYMAEYAAGTLGGALTAGALANRCAFVSKLADACRTQSRVVEQQQAGLSRECLQLQQRQSEHRRMEHLHRVACDEQARDRRRREQQDQDEAAVTQWIQGAG